MEIPIAIKRPFILNSIKHHISFVRYVLTHKQEMDESELVSELSKGGNLFCDYYHGVLDIKDIVDQIEYQLQKKGLTNRELYLEYIDSLPKPYFKLTISDKSIWTLLKGNKPDRYIHLHPARYSPKTIRVRFLALKSAILLKYFYGSTESDLNHEEINEVRVNLLNESPLKTGGNISHLRKILKLLDSYL